MSPESSESSAKFDRLLGLMARLRAPGGCPWDREQSVESLRRYLIEEAYEVIDAIDRQDWAGLAEELGDVQLQIVFQSQIASENGWFSIDDVLDHITDKLVRRHPHVFGAESAETAGEVLHRWDEIKAEEKRAKGSAEDDGHGSLLDSVPRSQPAVLEAREIGKRVAKAGLDWAQDDALMERIEADLGTLRAERQPDGQGRPEEGETAEENVGELLFLMVALARRLRVDPEMALRHANRKFRERFQTMEVRLREQGRRIEESEPHERERLWQEVQAG